MTLTLRDKILWQIYTSYPFTLEEIESAYSRLKSYDTLISACEIVKKKGRRDLVGYIDKIKSEPDTEE